jgi:hypothetical protein
VSCDRGFALELRNSLKRKGMKDLKGMKNCKDNGNRLIWLLST